MDPIPYAPVRYDRERHEAFVRSSWTRGAREPWTALAPLLRRPDVTALVAHAAGDPDSLLGWACVEPGPTTQRVLPGGVVSTDHTTAIVWVYVRDFPSRVRRRGLGTSLLLDAGADVSTPTPCLYWSPYAAILAARGYRLVYSPYTRKEGATQ